LLLFGYSEEAIHTPTPCKSLSCILTNYQIVSRVEKRECEFSLPLPLKCR
jgi:hypothetical protein